MRVLRFALVGVGAVVLMLALGLHFGTLHTGHGLKRVFGWMTLQNAKDLAAMH